MNSVGEHLKGRTTQVLPGIVICKLSDPIERTTSQDFEMDD